MDNSNIKIIEYDPMYAVETVQMWRDSKERAIGQKEIHSFEGQVHFLNHILTTNNQVKIAIDTDQAKVIAMVAFNEHEVNQLYIHNDYQGKGLGRQLLDIAKRQSTGKLTLYTFEVNHKAQRFYEKNGFRIVARGHENEENLPDILYEWNE